MCAAVGGRTEWRHVADVLQKKIKNQYNFFVSLHVCVPAEEAAFRREVVGGATLTTAVQGKI